MTRSLQIKRFDRRRHTAGEARARAVDYARLCFTPASH